MADLLVTYPGGSTSERTVVVAVTPLADEILFAVERTPCHPESPRWPDQPADRCTLEIAGVQTRIECAEGFLRGAELALGAPEEDREAVRCVVHRAPAGLALRVGVDVALHVDERYRALLSHNHSRCHLASLALNAALAGAWRKDPGAQDSLGNPDFDKLAILSSVIDERGSVDTYRAGKHLRKAGFLADAVADTEALAREIEAIARHWVRSGAEISVTPAISSIDERRVWSCRLDEDIATFPCGGTHPCRLGHEDAPVVSVFWISEERQLVMTAEPRASRRVSRSL